MLGPIRLVNIHHRQEVPVVLLGPDGPELLPPEPPVVPEGPVPVVPDFDADVFAAGVTALKMLVMLTAS